MIKVVSVDDTRKIEAAADEAGTSYDTMMNRAGAAVAQRAITYLDGLEDARITVIAGSGNNGGDGLVAARLIAEHTDIEVRVYLTSKRDDHHTKALAKHDILVALAEDDQQFRVLKNMVSSAHLLIDAMFGIGVRLPIEGDNEKILRNIHQALNEEPPTPSEGVMHTPTELLSPYRWRRPYVVAVDCPSGIDCDTGEIDKQVIKADETVTFIAAKTGLLTYPAAEMVGTLHVATLGIPDAIDELATAKTELAFSDLIRNLLPGRKTSAHKGSYGKVMILAGSTNYIGAPGMAAAAAYRSGAGLVTVGTPMPVVNALASQLMEPTWLLLPHDMGVLSEGAHDLIMKEIAKYHALLIGPGLATEDTTRDLLTKLLQSTEVQPKRRRAAIGFVAKSEAEVDEEDETADVQLPPLVLDADALNLLAQVDDWHTLIPANTILTPHPGEMGRLADMEIREIESNRLSIATEKAAAWNCVVLLKGAHTIIAAPDGRVTILPFKTSALATAGTGDVLAGMIVSFLAQGLDAYEAAVVGGYLHGAGGQLAADYAGSEQGVVATDIVDVIAEAIGQLL